MDIRIRWSSSAMLRDCDEVLLVGLTNGERDWAVRVRPSSISLAAESVDGVYSPDIGGAIAHYVPDDSVTRVTIDGVTVGDIVFYPRPSSGR